MGIIPGAGRQTRAGAGEPDTGAGEPETGGLGAKSPGIRAETHPIIEHHDIIAMTLH